MQDDVVAVPVVGVIAAGQPILAVENIVGEMLVDAPLVRRSQCFALQVTGDSMMNAGIGDGDYVVVRQQQVAESGDIVVALLGEEATLKRLGIDNDHIELRSENPEHPAIQVAAPDEVQIQGKVIAVNKPTEARIRPRRQSTETPAPGRSLRIIDELERAVCDVASERKLRDMLAHGLDALRHRYRRAPDRFGQQDLVRLQQLRHVCSQVTRSVELLESASYVQNEAEYASLRRELGGLARSLATLPVGQTIAEERERLPARLPAIQAQEKQQQDARDALVRNALEDRVPQCPHGHVMKVRRGRRGLFWGCSAFPDCLATRELTAEDLAVSRA
jgi:hypothetical protein